MADYLTAIKALLWVVFALFFLLILGPSFKPLVLAITTKAGSWISKGGL